MRDDRKAFSLLELSVVIALIGLIAGVVFIGQSFSSRYKLRTVLVDANNYAVAIQQFQVKYSALPGDMPDATRVWGRVGDGTAQQCANPLTDASTGVRTCDGDGDGFITAANCENYRVWQHLSASELITGSYTGVSGTAGCAANSMPGINVPTGPVKKSGFSIDSFGYPSTLVDANNPSTVFFDGDYRNAMVFGATTLNSMTVGPAINADVAKELDQKADDGRPDTGTIRAVKSTSASTPNCAKPAGTSYNDSYQDVACALIFMNSYQQQTQQ